MWIGFSWDCLCLLTDSDNLKENLHLQFNKFLELKHLFDFIGFFLPLVIKRLLRILHYLWRQSEYLYYKLYFLLFAHYCFILRKLLMNSHYSLKLMTPHVSYWYYAVLYFYNFNFLLIGKYLVYHVIIKRKYI